LFARVAEQAIEAALLAHQAQVLGAPPKDEFVVLDGKGPGHSGGLNVVSAVTARSWPAQSMEKRPASRWQRKPPACSGNAPA
jgi:hypothetical protein